MLLTLKEKNYLLKNNLYIYFIVEKFVGKREKSLIFNLYCFYKTLSSYVDLKPVNQEAYFNFKDRYYKAQSGIYILDRFIAEEYVAMWVSLEQLLGKNYDWHKWTNQFMEVKDQDLRSVTFNSQDSLFYYLQGHEGLGMVFLSLLGWDDEQLELPSRYLVFVLKYQSLILKVKEDSLMGRRYLPLLDTDLLSISEIELIRKPESFRVLIREHLNIIEDLIQKIIDYLPKLDKKKRVLFKTLLSEIRRINKRIYQEPQALFTKNTSYFKVSFKRLSRLYFWYRVGALFQK